MAKRRSRRAPKQVGSFLHEEDKRTYIPSAEHQSLMAQDDLSPIRAAYERRNRDLDPQLVWRGKDVLDEQPLYVQAPPLFVQEKVHPKALIDDLRRMTDLARNEKTPVQPTLDLFADFNGLPDDATRTEFYQHEANWSNRMILGDSLQVMASLAEREGLRGKVQCIYIDPPYGIKFNSNFQWSTTSRDVRDGKKEHITREPEQVKAFRDTWRDGIHSYLSYLRDRLTLARELLTESGSCFVQIGDENVHRVRALMDEVFGAENYQNTIYFTTTGGFASSGLSRIGDFIVWYTRDHSNAKHRHLHTSKRGVEEGSAYNSIELKKFLRRRLTAKEIRGEHPLPEGRIYRVSDLCGQGRDKKATPFEFRGRVYKPTADSHWKPNYPDGLRRIALSDRIYATPRTLNYVRFYDDYPVSPLNDVWLDTGHSGFAVNKTYVVQTNPTVIERCILMTTDPGDLVLDPTCGSGTAAYVAEQWGRRWITIDTSRVALALARARIMGARYPYYILADSVEGQRKTAEVTGTLPAETPAYGRLRQGFVYERVPHITLRSIANNAEIDVIWEDYQTRLEPLREKLNQALGRSWEEWEIPRDAGDDWPPEAGKVHAAWWRERIARQKEIDASVAAKADYEYLYDKPYENRRIVRVAGPFTVESLSPHRMLGVDENDETIDPHKALEKPGCKHTDYAGMILDNLRTAGIQQAHKEGKIDFVALRGWPGRYICAEGRYLTGQGNNKKEVRAGIFIGPEFGTVARPDLVAAAREAGDAGFDTVIACAFSYSARCADTTSLGRIPILQARMNADLHMAEDLKKSRTANLFVIFGEPDIDILDAPGNQIQVKLNGVDIYRPSTGKVESNDADEIACWFIDSDYDEESFFVRQAYFLGANDPYKSLKTTLKAEIDREAWESLHSDISRPFDKPSSGRIAVKVINHLGDEVLKVFRVKE